MTSAVPPEVMELFGRNYAALRREEGRAYEGADLLALPYLNHGPLASEWSVRARTFDAFLDRVVRTTARRLRRPLKIIDLGAGNGWLSFRLAAEGHACTAIDIRDDRVDGLGAADDLVRRHAFDRRVASFDALPLPDRGADIAVFNASLHYATDLAAVLEEAARCLRPGGTVAVLDSPFYARSANGEAMVAEKHRLAKGRFGARTQALLALPHIEYLTRERLARASAPSGLVWHRHRVRYPLWYELRPLVAALRRRRRPSRFDLWTAEVPTIPRSGRRGQEIIGVPDILLTHGYSLLEDEKERQIMKPDPPLGLVYISTLLRRAGFDTEVHDSTWSSKPELFARLAREPGGVLGIYTNLVTPANEPELRLRKAAGP